ncbi:carbohydrate ABC transporter permease [Ferrovibrio sp.]|uniref:carbohydrate ABC transporter permease n=1 Tax=Ferrovibrio sp. TaxID=1917215 RepID=UPI00260E20BB|nr:carbohydrate ABC transporter permease [Ferrovibrio sp.]
MRKIFTEARLALIGILILIWTLIPIYHLFVMSITPRVETFAGALWPSRPTLENYETVVEQGHYYLEHFWRQLWNSAFVAVMVCVITLAIAATATFAISRLKVRGGRLVSNMALATYLIPPAFLAIPMYKVMGIYGLLNTQWSLILTMVTFASPYAIWVLKQYADKLPYELDEAARIDGASPLQIFRLIYLPLMAPSLVAIGTYALLLAWNEYLYAFLLLSADKDITLAVALGHFLTTDDAPFNVLMATGAVYALPPAAVYYAFRRYMVSGLTAGAVKS